MAEPISIYIIHHEKDSIYLKSLKLQLGPLETAGIIKSWSAEEMYPGAKKAEVYSQKMVEASLVLALVSTDYLASDTYCIAMEKEAHRQGKTIMPIIIRACLWTLDDILKPLEPLPRYNGVLKVVSQWNSMEDAFNTVVERILNLVEQGITSKTLKTILFMGATPTDEDTLRLGEEIREIRDSLRKNDQDKTFDFKDEPAVRTSDIQQLLIQYKPLILHFSGHGSGDDGLVFEDAMGNGALVSNDALDGVFNVFKTCVQCVVLNACYSDVQAQIISKHIPYVVGMPHDIPDDSSISFSKGFYTAIGVGKSYEEAFEIGKNQMKIDGFNDWEPILRVQ